MKKAISLLLVLVMCLTLCACENNKVEDPTETKPVETTPKDTEPKNTQTEPIKTEPTTPPTEESTAPSETEPKLITVEITMDNWQEYFEITDFVSVWKNDFDEVESTKYGYCLSLKSEYADKVVDADVAFEYYFSEPCYVDIEYNIDTKHIIVGEVYTEDLIKDKNMSDIGMYATEEHYGTNSFNSSNIENGRRYKVMEYEYRGKALEVANNIATWCSAFYQNADITRIQGTLTIIE